MPRYCISLLVAMIAFAAGSSYLPASGLEAKPVAEQGAQHWVRVEASRADLAVALGDSTESVDYGTYQWLRLPAASTAALAAAGLDVDVVEDAFTLDLGGQRFDPLVAPPVQDRGWGRGPTGRADWRLVQFQGPVKQAWLDGLAGSGLQPVQYIHPFTYVVWGDSAALGRAAARPEVRWVGDFQLGYRVLPRFRDLGGAPIAAKAVVYRGAEDVRAALREAGADVGEMRAVDAHFSVVAITAPGTRFLDLAAVPGVYSLQPVPTDGGLRGEMTDQINAGNYDGSNQTFPGYLSYLSGIGVDGDGVIIANVDGGVQDNHPDLVGRMLPCTGSTCGGGASSGHGTHTAGIMAADGSSGVMAAGFLRGLGAAPGANLVEQVYSPTFTQPGGMLTLMTQSVENDAVISGNSWGPSGSPQGYDDDTRQVDVGARDALPAVAGDQPLNFVLSFMNGNGGTSSQGTPDEAKNIFTIGSTKGQSSPTTQILAIDDLSANSAHGPALDGRKIPHMVAPGCDVDSTLTGSGHGLNCGTSMASPHVSGAAALFVEYYRGLFGADPSPTLTKAAFIAAAKDLAGHLDADGGVLGHPFDSKQGWGRMLIDPVLDPAQPVEYVDQTHVFDNSGEVWTRAFGAADPGQPMRLMLVWMDAPGHGLGGSTPAWNNNLDLRITAGGNTYRGNVFGTDGYSTTGGTADDRNNTEGVFLQPAQHGGGVTVEVLATAINANALPNSGDGTDQDFALVCYNCVGEPTFTLAADPSSLSICTPANAVSEITVGSIQGFSTPVTLSASGNPAGTTASFTSNPVTPPNTSTLTIGNTGAAAAGDYTVVVEGTAGAETKIVNIELSVFTANPAAPTLTTPANGATDVSRVPTLTWQSVASAVDYTVEVATDAGFTNIVFTETTDETSVQVTPPLAETTTYFWRVRASNGCGTGANSATFSFTTLAQAGVLLVDDDDNDPDSLAAYTAVLDGLLGAGTYDIWDTGNGDTNEPTSDDLAEYSTVIWFTGDAFDTAGTGVEAGPGAAAEAALGGWLDQGNCLLISSQDYRYDHGQTAFMTNYLGSNIADDDGGDYASVSGQAGTPFDGLGPYTLSYPFSDFADAMTAVNGGVVSIAGDNSNGAAVSKTDAGSGYSTTFAAFPFEAVDTAGRTALISAFLDSCGGGGPTGEADLGLSLSDAPDPVAAGAALSYVVELANFGPDAATNASVEVELPAEVSFVSGSQVGGSGTWSCSESGGTATCNLTGGSIAMGTMATLQIDTTVAPGTPAGTISATATASTTFTDPNASNDSDSTDTEVTGVADVIFAHDFECAAGLPGCEPLECTQLLIDPSMEDVQPAVGLGSINPNWPGTVSNAPNDGLFWDNTPNTGTFHVWFGGYGIVNETHEISQTVTIPAGNPRFLNFFQNVTRAGTGTTNELSVTIGGQEVDLLAPTVTSGYVPHSIDVSGFADGGSHEIKFTYTNAGGQDANWFIDDVTLDCEALPTPILASQGPSAAEANASKR